MSQVRVLNPARIYAARLAAGLTQEGLAHRLRNNGINATGRYINRWEKGANVPRADVVPALADALGVTIESLYGDSEDDEEDPAMRLRRVRAELVLRGQDDLAADLALLAGSFS